MKYDYGFKSNNADEFACIACVACVDRIKVRVRWKMVVVRSCEVRVIVDISACVIVDIRV